MRLSRIWLADGNLINAIRGWRRREVLFIAFTILVAGVAIARLEAFREAAIDTGDGGVYSVVVDPADFVPTIDNPWLPLKPGSRWVYEESGEGTVKRIEVHVTDQTRTILGIPATVVRVTETADGRVVEDTFDWHAQDRAGNVWYLGEETRSSRPGNPWTAAGSWEAGVDDALPGIVMKANPAVGDAYRQEYYVGHAEDMAEVVRSADSRTVPYGTFTSVLVTREWTRLEPSVVEEKSYALGIGLISEEKVQGGSGRTELISYEAGG